MPKPRTEIARPIIRKKRSRQADNPSRAEAFFACSMWLTMLFLVTYHFPEFTATFMPKALHAKMAHIGEIISGCIHLVVRTIVTLFHAALPLIYSITERIGLAMKYAWNDLTPDLIKLTQTVKAMDIDFNNLVKSVHTTLTRLVCHENEDVSIRIMLMLMLSALVNLIQVAYQITRLIQRIIKSTWSLAKQVTGSSKH